MILRLLFEEDEVGKRALAARDDPSGQRWDGGGWAPTEGDLAGVRPGTRPLTAGEVVENWDELENDHRDFRLALGLTPFPGGKGARD
ncbi:hypothetical protein JL720_6653 [Aureococcus anophagefferens]|nr:hypothetical protein JL720_6653 [Aureococcus anophagefferens]